MLSVLASAVRFRLFQFDEVCIFIKLQLINKRTGYLLKEKKKEARERKLKMPSEA